MSNEGKKCTVHYTGTFNDGTKFDSSYDRGEPIDFVCGAGMMIKGFDEAVKGMTIGDIIDVHLMPEEAYGMPDPDNILTVEISQLPGAEDLEIDLIFPTSQIYHIHQLYSIFIYWMVVIICKKMWYAM